MLKNCWIHSILCALRFQNTTNNLINSDHQVTRWRANFQWAHDDHFGNNTYFPLLKESPNKNQSFRQWIPNFYRMRLFVG